MIGYSVIMAKGSSAKGDGGRSSISPKPLGSASSGGPLAPQKVAAHLKAENSAASKAEMVAVNQKADTMVIAPETGSEMEVDVVNLSDSGCASIAQMLWNVLAVAVAVTQSPLTIRMRMDTRRARRKQTRSTLGSEYTEPSEVWKVSKIWS